MIEGIILHTLAGIIFSFFAHLILHETGHLIGGLITGWNFLFLQIFNVAVFKKKRSIGVKIINTWDFQCIMSPASLNSNPILYTMGGCFLNLLLTIIGLVLMIIRGKSMYSFSFYWCFFVMGCGFLIMNGVARVKQVCNDMACCQVLKKDSLTRYCHNVQLMIAKLLYKGCTYKHISEEIICQPFHVAYNDILAYQAILEYYYYLDTDDFEGTKKALDKIQDEHKLSRNTISYFCIERIYLNLIEKIRNWHQQSDVYKALETVNIDGIARISDIEHYLSMFYIKGDVHMERVKAVFDVYKELINGERERAREKIITAINSIRKISCIYSGEKEFCIRQLVRVQEALFA